MILSSLCCEFLLPVSNHNSSGLFKMPEFYLYLLDQCFEVGGFDETEVFLAEYYIG